MNETLAREKKNVAIIPSKIIHDKNIKLELKKLRVAELAPPQKNKKIVIKHKYRIIQIR